MNRSASRKPIAAALILVLLLAIFTGCESKAPAPAPSEVTQTPAAEGADPTPESQAITLCVDAGSVSDMDIRSLLDRFAAQNPGFHIEYEKVPSSYDNLAERENYLTRLRTEIMAGAGPDIFLADCYRLGMQGIFPFPKQAMNNRLFLPLDSYIEDAQLMDWDKLFPPVMEAGRNEEGQQILPLTFAFTMMLFDKETYSFDLDRPMTWDQMVQSDDPIVEKSACRGFLSDLFGELGDYEQDVPTFTEEELLARFQEHDRMEWHEGTGNTMEWNLGWLENTSGDNPGSAFALDKNGKEYYMLPAYNTSGGVTANIGAFAAINRNTAYPDQCFSALDYLLSKDAQAKDSLYIQLPGWPVHMEVGTEADPLHGKSMSEGNWREFSSLREQINAVKFYTPLDGALEEIARTWFEAERKEDRLEGIVHDQYMKVKMMLAES